MGQTIEHGGGEGGKIIQIYVMTYNTLISLCMVGVYEGMYEGTPVIDLIHVLAKWALSDQKLTISSRESTVVI